jgi:hypothetical protein
MANRLLEGLLAESPPALAPAGEGAAACAGCGLAGGSPDDGLYLRALRSGETLCRVCALGPTAAWEPDRVRLLLAPELDQGRLNGLVTRLAVELRRARAGEPVPAGIDAVLLAHWLETLMRRARATAAALPWAATPARARHTLRALPAGPRARLLAELAALRYLPDPADPALARFFDRRRALDPPLAVAPHPALPVGVFRGENR